MLLKILISTGNGNYASPDLTKYYPSNPIYAKAEGLTYPPAYDPLYFIASGEKNNLVDFNGNDCQTVALALDAVITSLRSARASYQTLTLSQQNLRLPALDFVTLLREVCRSNPLCTLYFYP
jgi:hypothetical protein